MRCSRRTFLVSAALSQAAQAAPADLTDGLPNFCTHEHWGSITCIGTEPGGYRADFEAGATPRVAATLFDLLLEPYLSGILRSGGFDPANIPDLQGRAFATFARDSEWQALQLLRPAIRHYRFTGTLQCTRRGILRLYGHDLLNLDRRSLRDLNESIAKEYTDIYGWYRGTMGKAGFSKLIRPVQPEYYAREQSKETAAAERAFTSTVMRIDPFLELWNTGSERAKRLAEIAGIQPTNASSWRRFLESFFELARRNKAVGIKQLQAYRRPLKFEPGEDGAVTWSGDLTPAQVRVFQDWVVHECCKLAASLGWAHQVHVGTHNLQESSPLPLASLASRYPRMKVVMIHCWPFLDECGWLARQYPNMYIDTCWQPTLNPEYFRDAISRWWNYVPGHKITCGHDATTVEMATGSAMFTRELLSEVLPQKAGAPSLERGLLRESAEDLLHNNAVRIYGIGEPSDVARDRRL